MKQQPLHDIVIEHEHGRYMPVGGHRARCACGWSSDCYAMLGDTQRAADVHLRRAKRTEFDALIARSSIGAAIDDIKKRGIAAHLIDLERAAPRPRSSCTRCAKGNARG